MDKTKQAVKDFMSKAGHHDTTVHEQVAPAVKHETVKPTRHEEVTTAVDKEVHQDHYHRQIQPVHDREVLPEQHKHNVGGVINREFDHRNHDETERALKAEEAKLRDERVVHETKHTQSRAPVVEGEHVHHHVHETIQPVIQKEVIQPEVVHTTVPVHEVHHNSAQHHGTTTLPPVHIDEFKKQGGVLTGRQERRSEFEGCPEGVHHDGKCPEGAHPGHTAGHTSTHSGLHTRDNTTTGVNQSVGAGHTADTHHTHGTTETGKKPSLLDRLNPMKDADHDGKKGLMD
ncbi:hypothetical protein BR93DRAFT_967735 [Coniochaeta sp. PMI_546]|nr:hypothetical protein BR93DRAFT_967735 [Coniochaeta sp. PMI_546]